MFHSILYQDAEAGNAIETQQPASFGDLNLDQVVHAITFNKQEYNLKPFFYTPLHDVETICYRQQIMQDLENEALLNQIKLFASRMSTMRRYLGQIEKLDYRYHREGWFLEAALAFCEAATCLARDLAGQTLHSRGLIAFREHLCAYVQTDEFIRLQTEAQQLKADLGKIRYCVLIKGSQVRVRKYEDEIDYSVNVEATFEKFKQGAVKDYLIKLSPRSGMSHIEAQILEFVARLYPDIFARLDEFCAQHGDFLDRKIGTFDREIQFYVSYLDYIAALKNAGLPFCYPHIINPSRQISVRDGFDIALAAKLVREGTPVVCNDLYLQDPERILVISGPNQGGKTTFARMFGQLHYLASLGCPVPARQANLFLPDQIWTHFEREEDIRNLRGKLQDDLVRIHAILERATPDSIIIINEIFTSTTLNDARFLGQKILTKIINLDALCVYVTFVDELASLAPQTVSMVSTIVPEDPTRRTYRIIRKAADGLAYALSIAQKHRLTYHQLKERIRL